MERLTTVIKFFVFILSIMLLFSCAKLVYERQGIEDYIALILKRDKSFYMVVNYWNYTYNFSGSWTKREDTIILDYKMPSSYISYEVNEKCINSDSIIVKIQIELEQCDYSILSFYINEKFASSFYGQSKYQYIVSDKIRVHNLRIELSNECKVSIYYKVKDSLANYFDIKIFSDTNNVRVNRVKIERNYFYLPSYIYIKKGFKLIPIQNNTIKKDLSLKRKFLLKKL